MEPNVVGYNEALAIMIDHLASLAGAVAVHRDKLVNELHFSEPIAESMCAHVHMKMVEMMCTPMPFR